MANKRLWIIWDGIFLFFLSLYLGSGSAELLTVCNEGCDFSALVEAMESANPGDVLEVYSGDYKENLRIKKSLILRGINTGAGRPVIDAGYNGSAVYILADGVTLEGFNLTNANGSRIDLYAGVRVLANDSVIRDISAFNNENGILLTNCYNGTLEGNYLQDNRYGIRIEESHNLTIGENLMQNNIYGLQLIFSNDNRLSSNRADKNRFGIELNDSENNTLIGNQMEGNVYNFGAEGYNDVAIDNLVDSRPIIYLIGAKDKTIDRSNDAGTVYCLDCQNVAIRGLNLSHNFYGVYIYNTTGSTVENNSLRNGCIGISLIDSNDNLLSENRVTENIADGLRLIDSAGNLIDSNDLLENKKGLYLLRSSYNLIQGNSISGGKIGAFLEASWRNVIVENNLSRNYNGLMLISSVINNISMNNVIDNEVGLYDESGNNNTIDNWMHNNTIQEEIIEKGTGPETGPSPRIPVAIQSNPPGADVLIDDKPQLWQTNGTATFPGVGSYDLELVLNNKRKESKIIIQRGEEPEPVFVDFNESNN